MIGSAETERKRERDSTYRHVVTDGDVGNGHHGGGIDDNTFIRPVDDTVEPAELEIFCSPLALHWSVLEETLLYSGDGTGWDGGMFVRFIVHNGRYRVVQ